VLKKHEIAFTERQIRFIDAIELTGRGGVDRSDIVRRALDARIQQFIDDGAIAEKDGGAPETVAPPKDKESGDAKEGATKKDAAKKG
jgi:hypothetical protein